MKKIWLLMILLVSQKAFADILPLPTKKDLLCGYGVKYFAYQFLIFLSIFMVSWGVLSLFHRSAWKKTFKISVAVTGSIGGLVVMVIPYLLVKFQFVSLYPSDSYGFIYAKTKLVQKTQWFFKNTDIFNFSSKSIWVYIVIAVSVLCCVVFLLRKLWRYKLTRIVCFLWLFICLTVAAVVSQEYLSLVQYKMIGGCRNDRVYRAQYSLTNIPRECLQKNGNVYYRRRDHKICFLCPEQLLEHLLETKQIEKHCTILDEDDGRSEGILVVKQIDEQCTIWDKENASAEFILENMIK